MKRRLSVIISIVLSICLAGCDDLKLRDKRELYDYEMGYRDEVPSAGVVSADAAAGVGPGNETASETGGYSQGENLEAVEEYSGEEGLQENPDGAPSENGEGNPGENGDLSESSGNPDADASGGSNTESSGNSDNNTGSSAEGSGGSDNSGTPPDNTGGSGNGQNSTSQSSDNNGNASGGSNGSNGGSGDSASNSNGSSDGSNGSNGNSNGSNGDQNNGQDGSGGSSDNGGENHDNSSSENGGENHDNSSSENGGENHDNGSSENGGENHDNSSSENGGGNQDNGGSGQQDNSGNNGDNTQNNGSGNQVRQDDSTKLHVRDVWTVEGSWSFTINSVIPGITVGDSERNPAAVYMIEYTYWNEGLRGDDGSDKELIFSLGDQIIDNAGRAGYGLNVDNPYEPQPVYPGQSCSAQIWVGVDNPGPFDVVVGEYDSTGNYQEVVYRLEV